MMEPLSHENNFNLVVGRFNGVSRLSSSSYSGALARIRIKHGVNKLNSAKLIVLREN